MFHFVRYLILTSSVNVPLRLSQLVASALFFQAIQTKQQK